MLTVPILVVVTGEGGSGGALGLAIGDRILMQEYAIYSVIPPEGCAAILWRDASQKAAAAEALKISAKQLFDFGIIDEIVPEPKGAAHADPAAAAGEAKAANLYIARSVRNEMLKNGVWAICEMEPNVRMYPALNMDERVMLEGLDITEAAIAAVQKSGNTIGDYPALPSGVVGF